LPVVGLEKFFRFLFVKGGGRDGMIFGFKIGDAPYLLELLARRPPAVDAWAEALCKIKLLGRL